MPGAMAPPMNSPRALMQSNVVAVPRSTTISGGPYRAIAATAFTMRSAPTSRGLSTLSGSGTLTPGSTVNGVRPKYFSHIHSSGCWAGGTTFEIATPVMVAGVSPRVRSSVSMNRPYSSAVCSRRLVSRQEASRRGPSYTPILVLVLPTSMASSIALRDLARHHAAAPAVRVGHDERAVGVHVHRHAADAVDRDRAAQRVGQRAPALSDRREALALEPPAPLAEGVEQRGQQRVAVHQAAAHEPDGGRLGDELGREHALREI